MRNIMLDLETMGVGSDAAIVSIGAVVFDPENDLLGETFYINVDLSSCLENGLSVTGATINWWMKQSDSTREALFENPVFLKDALTLFSEYVHKFEKPRVWGNGSGFDNEILKNAYKAAKLECPWDYYNDRDLRTLVDIGRSIVGKQSCEAIGRKHNALDDAINQAKLACKYWQLMSHQLVAKL